MNYEKFTHNIKILNEFEKGLGQPVGFKIKDPNGELKKVSKEEFAKWMTEGKEEKNVEIPPKESLVYGASGDIDGTTVFVERKGKDGIIKESYYQPRSEEEKKRIIEKNRKRREIEKSQETKEIKNIDLNKPEKELKQKNTENPPVQNKKGDRQTKKEKETNNHKVLSDKKDSNLVKFAAVGGILLISGVGLYYLIKPKNKK
ncbi:MAG: hypothetical protein I3273_03745 [Candidatus Moeniiplasma glomeromycotorum]|nr:hypothetical protein [Candidatus Moeniiplasma glomeromycotorum]MCE8167956.1 hypothetical protein [Candidatus Moeniiplasma glomeromycotorum]MCE8169209.1 hypothetical protein [Candidatus Moeniiplasma glomeromycotorum]